MWRPGRGRVGGTGRGHLDVKGLGGWLQARGPKEEVGAGGLSKMDARAEGQDGGAGLAPGLPQVTGHGEWDLPARTQEGGPRLWLAVLAFGLPACKAWPRRDWGLLCAPCCSASRLLASARYGQDPAAVGCRLHAGGGRRRAAFLVARGLVGLSRAGLRERSDVTFSAMGSTLTSWLALFGQAQLLIVGKK